MKGQAAITEALLVVLMGACISIVFALLPGLVRDTIKMLSLASAEVVARDLAGLISVSDSAPGEIAVDYDPPGKVSYDVQVANGIVYVRTKGRAGPGWYIFQTKTGTGKTWVDLETSMEDVSEFRITKDKDDNYVLEGF